MEYYGQFLALGVDTFFLIICAKRYFKYKNASTAVKGLQLHEIDSELEKKVNQTPDKKIPYIAVRGAVQALGSPINSISAPQTTGVIQKISLKEHVITRSSAGFWSDHERIIQEVYNAVPFILCKGKRKIEVIDALDADILDLETVADNFEPSKANFVDNLWGFFTGQRQRGLQTTEEMLREGSLITAIGELSGAESSGLKMQAPENGNLYFISSLPVSAIARRVDQQKRFFRLMTIALSVFGFALAIYMARKWIKQRENQLKQEQIRKERRKRNRDDEVPENQQCVVCRRNPREVILLPCGHVCLCEDCSSNIGSQCPVCRSTIETRAAAYIS